MRILESNRLILKPVEKEDLSFLLDLRWEGDIMDYLIHDPISSQSQQVWYENILKNKDLALSIFLKNEIDSKKTTIVGTVGLYNFNLRHQRATWRIRISSEYQGKGIAYESIYMLLDYGFNTLNINKIISDSFSDNLAIIKLSKKLGFIEEGTLREHYFHKGHFRDAIIFGLLREDFNKKAKG